MVLTREPVSCFTVPWCLPRSHSLTVVVKATAECGPEGALRIAEEPDPPQGDIHTDEDGGGLVYPSDFAILKPRADLLVSGCAYPARPGQRVGVVGFRFGGTSTPEPGASGDDTPITERRLAVFGDRIWKQALVKLAPEDAEPYERIPLVWERCFGGPGFEPNPVGVGVGSGPNAERLPNFEDPQHLIVAPRDRPAPASFGPISPSWKARRSLVGSYGRDWLRARWPWFPDDFDWGFFQAAPASQQREQVRGDEPFEILGMRPGGETWTGTLPALRPHCFARRSAWSGGEVLGVHLRLDTVLFDAEDRRVQLLWRGLLEVRDRRASEIDALYVALAPLDAPSPSLAMANAAMEETAHFIETGGAPIDLADPAPATSEDGANGGGRTAAVEPAATDGVVQSLRDAGVPSWWLRDDLGPAAALPEPEEVARVLASVGVTEQAVLALLGRVTRHAERARELRAVALRSIEAGASLDGVDWRGANLSDLDLAGRSLVGADLRDANLRRSRFDGAALDGALLDRADAIDAVFDGASLVSTSAVDATFSGASFRKARLAESDWTGCRANGCAFHGVEGDHVQLVRAELEEADFSESSLADLDLTDARLDGAKLIEAEIPRVRLYGASAVRVSFDRAGLEAARGDQVDLSDARLVEARAAGSVLDDARLDRANFAGAMLDGASLVRASCRRAVFTSSRLREAQLRGADLRGANLLGADCMKASFEEARVDGADLRQASLYAAETWRASFDGARLEGAMLAGSKLERRP